MQELLNRDIVPPDPVHFRYVHPETGHVSKSETYQSWVQEALTHRRANNLHTPAGFIFEMEDQLCSTLPAGWCKGVDPNMPRVDMRFNLRDVWNWGSAHVNMLLSGGFVPQEEAERRAKICAGCQMNIRAEGCTGCADVATIFTSGLAKRSTSSDMFLRNCAVCRCFLRALVHFPQSVVDKVHAGIIDTAFPSFCWQRKGGNNYRA
jgi:hypothetical protein